MVSAELPADHEMRRWLSPALIPTPCGVVGLASAYFTFTDACVSVPRSEEHTSELQSPCNLVCRLLLEKKKKNKRQIAVFSLYQRLSVTCILMSFSSFSTIRLLSVSMTFVLYSFYIASPHLLVSCEWF